MKVPEKCPLSSSCPVLMGGHRRNRSHSGLVTKELPSRRDMASWEVDGSGIVDRPQMARADFRSAQLQSGCDSFSPAVDGGDGGNFLQVSAVEMCEWKQADDSARRAGKRGAEGSLSSPTPGRAAVVREALSGKAAQVGRQEGDHQRPGEESTWSHLEVGE